MAKLWVLRYSPSKNKDEEREVSRAYEIRPVKLRRVYLDPDNPRHDPIENEPEIIAHLMNEEDIRPLARSIARLGSTSPLELIGLVPHPTAANAFISVEGNRRVCALKLLEDPDKAPTQSDRVYFRNLRKSMQQPITEVTCAIFPDSDVPSPYIKLRHERNLGGEGLRSWQPEASTRYAMRTAARSPNAQALLLLDYARRQELLPSDQLEELNLTTLTRYLPAVRGALGLVDTSSNRVDVPLNEFDRALKKFLTDATGDKPKVHSRSSAADRKEYGQYMHASGAAVVTRGIEPYEPTASSPRSPRSGAAQGAQGTSTKPQKRNKQDRDKARYVVPAGYAAPVDDAIFQRLFKELRTLDAHAFSFAATYLFRAVIERVATVYIMRKSPGTAVPEKMHHKLQKLHDLLAAGGYKGAGMSALRKMSSDVDSRYSPDTIGGFVHAGAVPTGIYPIRAWDTFEPIMSEVVRQLT